MHQQPWPMRPLTKYLSIGIDVLLLLAGALLWASLDYNPFQQTWLALKLSLLGLYIILGSFALKRAKTKQSQILFLISALLCVSLIVGIALKRHPAGWFLS